MDKKSQEEAKKIKELIDINSDIKKCEEYYSKIINGDFRCVEEAFIFTNNKYDELLITDSEIIIASGITKNITHDNRSLIEKTLGNLNSVHDLLTIKKYKKEVNKNNNECEDNS